jgi:hypothetical protein
MMLSKTICKNSDAVTGICCLRFAATDFHVL